MPTKILLIDDEKDILEAVSDELQAEGYLVLTASNGPEGLEITNRERPDLIFLDVMMPKMDGWRVLRTLKEDEATRKIPVVMLSGKAETGFLLESQRLQASDYLIKPFELGKLLASIRKYAWS